jgi:myo-inositol-1(or 4)-monophosphatase
MLEPGIISHVVALALEAGTLIRAELQRPGGPRGRGDKADVDLEIELMLRHGLEQIFSCDFLGEETGSRQSGHSYSWVVDPNDGTADFLAGRLGSAVSIGLLHRGEPVLGVVYAPVTARGPDCIAWQKGMRSLLRNGLCVDLTRANHGLHGSVVFVSAAAESKRAENDALCTPAACEPMPSIAYRLARTAVGDGAAGVSLYRVAPHDVVAGHALLLAVGADLFDQDGQPIRYTKSLEFSRPVRQCFGGEVAACLALSARPWRNLVSEKVRDVSD